MDEQVAEWKAQESRSQAQVYETIVKQMDELSTPRERWLKGFFERIQTRGWSFHAGIRKKIRRDQIPERPDRPWKVVF